MEFKRAIKKAIRIKGMSGLASAIGTTHQVIQGWQLRGQMPNTEYTGKTTYASKIQTATNHQVLVSDLLSYVPPNQVIEVEPT